MDEQLEHFVNEMGGGEIIWLACQYYGDNNMVVRDDDDVNEELGMV